MKITKSIAILMMLLICFTFVASAADTHVQNAQDIVNEKIANRNFIVEQKSHNPVMFDREVAGPLNIKIMSTQNKVPPGFDVAEDGYQTMVSFKKNGQIHIRDTEHKVETLQIEWSELQALPGFDGKRVLLKHYDDTGTKDAVWVQTVYNANGYAYLEDVPFSEIIVGGYTGTYSKINNEIDITDTINLGNTFDSDEVSSVTLTIDDKYSDKTDPYDIDTTGLAAWYRFDDVGSTVIDYSGNGNNGTFSAATYSTGKYNNAGVFDGLDDYANVPDDQVFNFTDGMTLSVIIDAGTQTDDHASVIDKSNNVDWTDVSAKDGFILFARYDNSLRFTYGNGSTTSSNPDDSVGVGTFENEGPIHVVITVDDYKSPTPKIKAYKDAVLVDSENRLLDGSIYTPDSMHIGEWSYINRHFNGTVDEVLLYNRPLSESEIEDLYYISASSLQAKTNSHIEYSTEWNSSADNPLSVPFGESESISSITFNQPESIVQNGVTIYDPINVLFNVTAELDFMENTTNIYEEVNGDSYQIFIQHIPGCNSTSGTVSFTSDPNDILSSPYLTTGMTTNNTNAAMLYNDATREWTVTTGAITAGEEYNYILYGVLEGSTLEEVVEGGFGSDNMHAYSASGNDTTIIGSMFRATYGDSEWGNESNDLWESTGTMIVLAVMVMFVGVIFGAIRRYRE